MYLYAYFVVSWGSADDMDTQVGVPLSSVDWALLLRCTETSTAYILS